MAIRRVAGIGLQLCGALEAAHLEGIVHRDLKPANIIVLDDPAVRDLIKVLDFGLARSLAADDLTRVTMSNAILGTPMYMAPEQIRGRETDQRADLYAFGCILFHMLVGRAPFDGDSVNGLLAAHLNDPIPRMPSTLPGELVRAIQHLLAKDPDQRAASVAEVCAALQAVIAAPAPVSVRRRWRAPVAIVSVLATIGVVSLVAHERSSTPAAAPAIVASPPVPVAAPPVLVPPPLATASPPAPAKPPKPRAAKRASKPAAPTIDFYPKAR